MEPANRVVEPQVIFLAVDESDDHYRYRQAFGEADPSAVLYFFINSAELISALRGYVYPKPALLLMDCDMDSFKGYDTLSALARTTAWQTIPVVIMSTLNHPVDEARCQQIGYGLVLSGETGHDKLVAQLTGLMAALL